MTVTTVTTHWLGSRGSARARIGGIVTSQYEALHIAQTDDALDQIDTVLRHFQNTSTLPYFGRTWNYGNDRNNDVVCVGLLPNKRADSRFIWDILSQYESRNLSNWPTGSPSSGGQQNTEGVLPDEYSVSSTQISVPVETAIYQGGMNGRSHQIKSQVAWRIGPVTNSAFTVYDPPVEKEVDIRIVRITRSYPGWSWVAAEQFRGGVNNADFDPSNNSAAFIDHWPAFSARLKDVSGTQALSKKGRTYWRVTWEFWIHSSDIGWRAQVVDRGLYRRALSGDDNGRGGTYAGGDFQDGMPRHDRILDPQGLPITEPVLLNGDGAPIKPPQTGPVYITYSIYAEVNYQALFGVIRRGA